MDIPMINLGDETLLGINENISEKKQNLPVIGLDDEGLLGENQHVDDTKLTQTNKLLCNACLSVGRTLHEITMENLTSFYLNALRELPLGNIPTICPSICWECKESLIMAARFKEQVKESYRILQSCENLQTHIPSGVVRPPYLKVSELSICIKPEDAAVQGTQECGRDSVVFKGELKVEWDGKESKEESTRQEGGPMSDCDGGDMGAGVELPVFATVKKKKKNKIQSKIKRAERVVKRIRNGVKNSKRPKGDQKIVTLELSYEEMLTERAKEATKESYLKAPYKCETCVVGFNYRRSYKAHNLAKHTSNLGKYICPICNTIISSVESFTSHYKRHMRRYECSICRKRTLDLKVMQQHYYSTHEVALKEYTCDLCGKISKSIDTHRYHKDTHKARVQCTECDKTFTHRAGLLNHRLSVHELHNAFPCTVCDKMFRWKTSLKRHLEKHDIRDKTTNQAAAYCEECEVTFSSISSYHRHMKNSLKHVTQDQLRFICDHCSKRFADKTKLRDHIEEKHLYKTYQCQICHKPSKNRVALDQHVRNVHKGRPNNKICHHCGKGFPTKVQLESHIRTHTGERPFICEYCPTTFSQQSNLYKHNRQVHLNIKSKRYPMCKKRREDDTKQFPQPDAGDAYRPVTTLLY